MIKNKIQICQPSGQGSSVTASPAGSSLLSSDSPASRGPSTSPSSIQDTREQRHDTGITSPPTRLPQSPTLTNRPVITVVTTVSNPIKIAPPVVTTVMPSGMEKAKNFSKLDLPPIPNLIPSPNYSSMVGQKRTRTLADAKNDMKRQRPSVISYGPLLKGTPVRVIQKVQKVLLECTYLYVIQF